MWTIIIRSCHSTFRSSLILRWSCVQLLFLHSPLRVPQSHADTLHTASNHCYSFGKATSWCIGSNQWYSSYRPSVPPSPFQASQQARAVLAQRPSHTGNFGGEEKNRKERRKKKLWGLPWSSCKANTDFHPSLPVKPVSLDRNTQVLQQVESRTAKLFRGSSENYLPLFLFPPVSLSIRLPELSFQPFCSLLLSLGKRWTLVLLFIFFIY